MLKFEDLPESIQQTLTQKNSGVKWMHNGIRRSEKGNIFVPDPDGWTIRKDLEILLQNPQFIGITIWRTGQLAQSLVYIFKE